MDIFYMLLIVLPSVHGATYWSADTYWNDRYDLGYTQSKYVYKQKVGPCRKWDNSYKMFNYN